LEVPIPTNLLLQTTNPDLTLRSLGPAGSTDYGNPLVALGQLDGWSTIEKWAASFVDDNRVPTALSASSVVPGGSVRFFEIIIDPATTAVLGIKRELTPGVDYWAAASGSNLAIIPLQPLKEMTAYMAVLTDGITDADGNDATPDQTYFLAKRTDPLVDSNGNSTDPLLDDATARALEPLRQLVNTQEAAAASAGVDPASIVLSWTANTLAVTPVLKVVRGLTRPAPTTLVATGMNTSAFGLPGIADIYMGVITLNYYLGVPDASDPDALLTDFWTAEPGAYVPPFDQFGLDPNSNVVTVANPIPLLTDMQTVPVFLTIPNAGSGMTKPAAGWPVVIYGHGLGGNRTQLVAIADTNAKAGYATIGIDFPLHGVVPEVEPHLAPFYIENTPFGAFANERTFDVDLIDNATGAPGSDMITDPSGAHSFNLGSLLTSRDNNRQGVIDLSALALSIPSMDYDGDTLPDLDGSNIAYVGLSYGGIEGTVFAAIEPLVRRAFLSVPAGGLVRALEASPTFGPRIRAGLSALGVEPGSADYEQFLILAQTIFDAADPINWGAEASALNSIVLHEVIDEQVLPNEVPGAPLSGTEPLIRTMGLAGYNSTQSNPAGLNVAGRFNPPATHGSLLSPALGSPAATAEMQAQMATFIGSFGTTVVVTDASTMKSP
jgi:pimeloyl-ACP methyl ester carboxylesterase